MKRVKILFLAGIMLTLALGFLYVPGICADTSKLVTDEKSFLFAIPEGGWSTARVRLSYKENYSLSGNNSIFSSRTRTVLFQSAYATSAPYYSYGTLKHSNGKTFTSWTKESIIFGNPWQSGTSYINKNSVTYPRTTSVKGTLNITVHCNDATVPSRAMSVTQTLNTK